ncbi:MAG: alpha/beta fold hydrolase [Defluviitaleaceae bacterium]|nr:alpha/beta fold hydrolase [Defluviitaleaceae bacterium]
MRNYAIFLKKELMEALKTHKLLILGAVALFFGMLGPLTAFFLPEIFRLAMESDPSMAGMDFGELFSDPAAVDSWMQFYSNINMFFIVIVVMFSGMLSSEMSRGTLRIMLSKGLSRTAVVLAKFTSASIIWTFGFAIAAFTSWAYTAVLFDDHVPNLAFAMLILWAFGMFLLAATTFAATLTNKSFICMLIVGAIAFLLAVFGSIPGVGGYNPMSLSTSANLPLDVATPRQFLPALAVTVIGIVSFIMLAVVSFNKKGAGKKAVAIAGFAVIFIGITVFFGQEMPRQIALNRHVISESIIIGEGTEWELHGLLTLPRHTEGAVPAVVLVHGSGAQNMNQTIFDNEPFRDVAEYLSQNGIAVIRYNKRTLTHGRAMSRLDGQTIWEESIEDAILAANLLRADPRISEVYILGHSLGGMLAPRIHANGGDFDGIIIWAGSPRFVLDISRNQALDTGDPEIIEANTLLMDEFFDQIRHMPPEEVRTTYFRHWGNMGYYWLDMYNHPVPVYLEKVDVPMLIMHPDDDVQVLTEIDFAMYKELLEGRDNVTFKLYPGLNHLFMPSRDFPISEILNEYRIRSRVDEQVLRDIVEWIAEMQRL